MAQLSFDRLDAFASRRFLRLSDDIHEKYKIVSQADMKALSDLPTHGNEYRFTDILPILYYRGDGNKMELAVPEQVITQ